MTGSCGCSGGMKKGRRCDCNNCRKKLMNARQNKTRLAARQTMLRGKDSQQKKTIRASGFGPNRYNRKFTKPLPVPGTDLKVVGVGRDVNGNSIIRFQPLYGDARGFSIQTNVNLPIMHRGINSIGRKGTHSVLKGELNDVLAREIHDYISNFGTKRQTLMALNRHSGGKLRGKETPMQRRIRRGERDYAYPIYSRTR